MSPCIYIYKGTEIGGHLEGLPRGNDEADDEAREAGRVYRGILFRTSADIVS